MEKAKIKLIMGQIVATLRNQRGLTRYALAKNSGVDSSWLRRFEQGKSGIRVETLIALARGLRIGPEILILLIAGALDDPETWWESFMRTGKLPHVDPVSLQALFPLLPEGSNGNHIAGTTNHPPSPGT